MILLPSHTTAYFHTNGFNTWEEILNLTLRRCVCNSFYDRDETVVLYKLRGCTRKYLALYYTCLGIVLPDSVLGQLGIESNVSSIMNLAMVMVLLLWCIHAA